MIPQRPAPLLVPCVGLCGAGVELHSLPSRPAEMLDGDRNPGAWSLVTLAGGAIGLACPKCSRAPARAVLVDLAFELDGQASP